MIEKYIEKSQKITLVGLKGTLSVILNNPQCKNDNTRFTTLPLKTLSDNVWIRYQYFLFIRSNEETHRKEYFSSQKYDGIFYFFDQAKVSTVLL